MTRPPPQGRAFYENKIVSLVDYFSKMNNFMSKVTHYKCRNTGIYKIKANNF